MADTKIIPHSLFKVVWIDVVDSDYIAQHVVSENLSEADAWAMCNRLREESEAEFGWWVVKPQEAQLWGGIDE